MKCHGCGQEVPAWTRFHHAPEGCGQYTTPDPKAKRTRTSDPDGRPANIVRAARFFGDPPHMAPAPGSVPPKGRWLTEEELRGQSLDLLETLGYDTSDLEQGYRGTGDREGSSRVRLGIADAYVTHARLGVRAWIEFKRWDNEPGVDQIAFGEQELAAGGCYLVVYETAQLVAWHEIIRRSST